MNRNNIVFLLGMVREKYSGIAMGNGSGCMPSCCGGSPSLVTIVHLGKALDYSEKVVFFAYVRAVKP
jgi:hypothetical protein